MEPSRFWLRRTDEEKSRQVVYDQLQLDRYTDRERRAILKLLARGKSATHREIAQAVRRASLRPRGEAPIAITLLLFALAVLIVSLATWHRNTANSAAARGTLLRSAPTDRSARSADPTGAMEDADKAWLRDVGAGKVATASDGSDALSLSPDRATVRRPAEPPPKRSR